MSTQFRPLEIPAGVVAKATKQQRSTNWAEVNLMRWVEGQMSPVGGQSQFNFTFASRCKKIHGWFDRNSVYHVAYLCEANLYVVTGGALIDISPTPPLVSPTPVGSGGYGDGIYNSADPYGRPPHIETIQALDKVPSWYSLDNFGSILYAMTSADGRLLKWDPAVGGAASVQVADSGRGPVPLGRGFVVTNERYIMVFGTASDGTVDGGKPNRFAWCDQENPGAWDYVSVTSQAGFLDIEPASPIITASSTRNGIIFFTAKKAYNSVYLGMPYIYNYTELGSNCTPWSPQSITPTASMIIWMSKQGMFSFDGTSILPMNCLVRPWIDDDIDDLEVREQACMVHVGDFNEVWWFFPQNGFTKNSRCTIYSYKEGWWSMGRMARTAGIASSYTAHTIMADDLVAYQHEVPYAYPANVPLPWAETYDLNLNSGAKLTTVKQLIPDIDGAVANVLYSLFYRTSRSLALDANGNIIPAPEQQTPPKQVRSNGYVDFRVTARDIRLRIEIGAPPGQPRPPVYPVTVGQHLIDSVPRGDR
jgi:hypothetical protein